MAKKFLYRGHELEELQEMTIKEFAGLVPSRQRRTLLRGLSKRQKKLLKDIKENRNRFTKTHDRDMIILPEMVGVKMGIHSGKEFQTVVITENMIGHFLGEYALTRGRVKHSSPGFGATRSSKFVPLK
ncbi:30S ribosomal protein S19 [Candidatus Aenigmatarchaeota archaeon]